MARSTAAGIVVAGLLLVGSAWADERYDHRGAVGLLLAGGAAHSDVVSTATSGRSAFALPVLAGVTFAVDHDGDEIKLMGRSLLATPTLDLAAIAGYRAYFGMDRWKTFFDLDLIAFARPTWGLGPRIGFGVQYELTSILGVFASAAAQLGYGNAFRIDVDALIGLQLRSYLLE